MRALYLALVCCLILTACSSGKAAPSNKGFDQTHKPTMDVKTDISGNQITVKVTTDMTISAEHYGMERQPGEGHIHMYLDNGQKIAIKEGQMVFKDLASGQHTLKVSLHNNDHTPYDVTKTIEFAIK
jgi:hypothetical protein